jgi:alpha-L-fucosidase 2
MKQLFSYILATLAFVAVRAQSPAQQFAAPPQSAAPQSLASQSARPQCAAPQSAAPQSIAPQSATPQSAAPQPPASQSAAPQSAASQPAASQPVTPKSKTPQPRPNPPAARQTTQTASTNLKLWYAQPAHIWTEALPIGNGDLGAIIFSGITDDHLQLNESTFWTGRPRSYQLNDAHEYLDTIRKLLFEDKQPEAESLAQQHFMGRKDPDEAEYAKSKAAWQKKVRTDTSLATADAKNWPTITVPTPNGWENTGIEALDGIDGAIWFQTEFDLPEAYNDKPLWLDLGRIRDVDYTYINGHLIGTAEGISTKRHYLIPASALHKGRNKLSVQVLNYDDKGGFTGLKGDKPPFILYPEGTPVDQAFHLPTTCNYKIQNQSPPPLPKYEAEYQPFGDLHLQFEHANPGNYRRELDLQTAIAKTEYTANGIRYTREYLSSAPDKALIIHLTADKPGAISFKALLKTPQREFTVKQIDAHTLELSEKAKEGVLKGVAILHIETRGGQISSSQNTNGQNNGLTIEHADEVTLTLTAATSFVNYHDVSANAEAIAIARSKALQNKSWATLKSAHLAEYQKLFNRFSIHLGTSGHPGTEDHPRAENHPAAHPAEDIPTDQRIIQYTPEKDPEFISLYVQYARYLLISSSRPGAAMPANLQGIWNDDLTPPWGSKYTTNINLQMNYWPAEALNLADCEQPLFKFIKNLSTAGQATAKAYYDAPGWVLHHNTDLWCGTAPINASNHGIWPTGGAWLCAQIWEHYLYTKDRNFLKEYYPILRSAASFFAATLVKDPKTGLLISSPSASPEHGGLVAGPTMDHQIIRELFRHCIAAESILAHYPEFQNELIEKLKALAPNTIGRHGQLQEWLEDKDDTADTHRHISHLWGVYPGADITWKDEAMMRAARQSLLYRGDEGTGWSLAWKVNCWARFRDGDHALKLFNKLLSNAVGATGEHGGVYPNMFDAHPPFQIDGNFGGAAGLAEMLLQSQDSVIDLLPALPSALPAGEIKGLKARGGFEVQLSWKDHQLENCTFTSTAGGLCTLRYRDKTITIKTLSGKTYHLNGNLK